MYPILATTVCFCLVTFDRRIESISSDAATAPQPCGASWPKAVTGTFSSFRVLCTTEEVITSKPCYELFSDHLLGIRKLASVALRVGIKGPKQPTNKAHSPNLQIDTRCRLLPTFQEIVNHMKYYNRSEVKCRLCGECDFGGIEITKLLTWRYQLIHHVFNANRHQDQQIIAG